MKAQPNIRMRGVMHHGELYLCRADVLEGMHAAAARQDPEVRQIMASFIDWFTENTRAQRDGGDA